MINSFLTSSDLKTNYQGTDDTDIRKLIVDEAISEFNYERFEKLKFNHENEIPSIANIDLEDIDDFNLPN